MLSLQFIDYYLYTFHEQSFVCAFYIELIIFDIGYSSVLGIVCWVVRMLFIIFFVVFLKMHYLVEAIICCLYNCTLHLVSAVSRRGYLVNYPHFVLEVQMFDYFVNSINFLCWWLVFFSLGISTQHPICPPFSRFSLLYMSKLLNYQVLSINTLNTAYLVLHCTNLFKSDVMNTLLNPLDGPFAIKLYYSF